MKKQNERTAASSKESGRKKFIILKKITQRPEQLQSLAFKDTQYPIGT